MMSSRAFLIHQQFTTFFPFSKLYPFSGARWMWEQHFLKIAYYSEPEMKTRYSGFYSHLTSLGLEKSLHLFLNHKFQDRILPGNNTGNIISVSIQHIVNKLTFILFERQIFDTLQELICFLFYFFFFSFFSYL